MDDSLAWWANASTVASFWGAAIYSAYRCRRSLWRALLIGSRWTGFAIAAYFQAILKYVVNPVCAFCESLRASLATRPKGLTLTELMMIISIAVTNDHGIEI